MSITVNALGDICPIPVVKTIRAINAMTDPGTVEIHVDNETAVQNLKKFANSKGFPVSAEKQEENHYVVCIQAERTDVSGQEAQSFCSPLAANTVVVFDGSGMGRGDEALAATLMKGFIYALSQLETLPRTLLFYNGGARLTTEGSLSLEDLRSMEAQGVEILTCGTCLNYYGLTEKLAVGSVTNMYSIVEKLNAADKIIKP